MANKVFGKTITKESLQELVYPSLATVIILAALIFVFFSVRFLLGIQGTLFDEPGISGGVDVFHVSELAPFAPRLGIDPDTLKPTP